MFGDKSHIVDSFRYSGTNSVDETTKLVGRGGTPDCQLACFYEMAIIECCSRSGVDHCIDG